MTGHKNILVIGSTSVVGKPLINLLSQKSARNLIYAATRDISRAKRKLENPAHIAYRKFDLTKPQTFKSALENITTVYLIRPPQITKISQYFSPFLKALKQHKIKEIIFQSVQGATNNFFIPHHHIERLIKKLEISYVFIRPSYFMQNLTTGLLDEINKNNRLYVPAGNAAFNWLDTRDFARAAQQILFSFEEYKNMEINLSGKENYTFKVVAQIMSQVLETKIKYKSPGMCAFYWVKTRNGMGKRQVLFMALAHFYSRFKKPAKNSITIDNFTGLESGSMQQFIKQNKTLTLGL